MDNTVDIERIMEEIRDEITRTGNDKQPLSFTDVESTKRNGDLDEAIDYISYNYEVQPYAPLPGNKIAVFFKKVIRKITGFFILPVVRQQNTLNYYYYRVSETIGEVKSDNEELKKRADNLEKRIKALEEKQGK